MRLMHSSYAQTTIVHYQFSNHIGDEGHHRLPPPSHDVLPIGNILRGFLPDPCQKLRPVLLLQQNRPFFNICTMFQYLLTIEVKDLRDNDYTSGIKFRNQLSDLSEHLVRCLAFPWRWGLMRPNNNHTVQEGRVTE